MRLAIIIPAYNEAATISAVVSGARTLGDVIVVNDGSKDDTAALAVASGATVVNLAGNSGYEAALGAGFAQAMTRNYDLAMTMDADGQHRLSSAQQLLHALDSADVVVGTRRNMQRASEWLAGWVGTLMWQVPDPFSGLKLYRLATCSNLAPFDTYHLAGAEMMVRAHRANLKLICVCIHTDERADEPRFDSRFRANWRLLRATAALIGLSWGMLR